jgi:HD-GYP domain-containing protein (c-di-GMP phosphodiesterase class II)
MKLSSAEVQDIQVAGLLHDVGKIDISLDVLRKASALDEHEWQEIRSHTMKGSQILRPMGGLLRDVIPLVEAHHENFDGTGYHGMKGEEIPVGARILTVADAYDAMVCDRPYRTGRTSAEALREIERCSGTQFDPEVVTAFKAIIHLRLVHRADEFPATARVVDARA